MKILLRKSTFISIVALSAILSGSMSLGDAFCAACLIMLSLLLHECGHVLIARRHGVAVEAIGISWLGGFTIRQYSGNRVVEIQSALAGPTVNLLLASLLSHLPGHLWQTLASVNLLLGLTNLIPVPPADGWKIVKELQGALGKLRSIA
jgi:Zn-dependent protease